MHPIRVAFAAAAMLARQSVSVFSPALGVVYVKRLTVAEVQERRPEAENTTPIASLLARGIIDEGGSAVFDAANPQDVELLSSLNFADVSPILDAINGKNGLGPKAEAQALKNSPPSAGSSLG